MKLPDLCFWQHRIKLVNQHIADTIGPPSQFYWDLDHLVGWRSNLRHTGLLVREGVEFPIDTPANSAWAATGAEDILLKNLLTKKVEI